MDLHDEGQDQVDHFDPWCSADLVAPPGLPGFRLDDAYCQVALAGVVMGDVGAVSVIQEAHTRLLLAHKVM